MPLTAEQRNQLEARGGELYRTALREGRKLTDAEERELRAIERQLDADEYARLYGEAPAEPPTEAQRRFLATVEVRARGTHEQPRILTRDMSFRDYVRGSYPSEYEHLSLGKFIRGFITGDWRDAEGERRAMSESVSSAGATIPTPLSANLIDAVRNRSVAFQAGARIVPMTSATLKFAKLTTDFTAGWYAENAPITASDGVFGSVTFTARKVGAIAKLSRELVEDAPNAAELVEAALAEVLAVELDRVVFHGSGVAPEPTGIINQANVQTVSGVGTPTDYSPFIEAIGKILTANGNPTAIVYAPRTWETLEGFRDTTQQPLIAPASFQALRKLVSNQIATNLGTGGNESVAFLGGFEAVGIGMRQNVTIETSREAGSAFSDDQVWIKVTARADVQLFRPEHLVTMTGITAA